MNDEGPARWRAAGAGLSFLNAVRQVGGKASDVALGVGGAVSHAVSAVKDSVLDNGEFDRIKSFSVELAKERPSKARHYSEQEWAEAERKADEVLQKLYAGYFVEDFDSVKYELELLTVETGQEEIDARVERLTTCVEKATGKLARHVFKKRDQLLSGITLVTSVEDDLKAAFMISRSTRVSLKQSGEEIMRNMRVVGQTRRKRYYLELLEVLSKIKRARSLHQSLKKAQEMGEYGEAILLCVQCFQGVESLKELKVSGELRATTQRLYVETLGIVDSALTAICSEFDPNRYSKVLEAYMLQGIQGKHLAEKVLHSFREAICDATMKVVRSLLLTNPKMLEKMAAGGSIDGTYAELCGSLPVDLLRPCLLRQMEVLYDILASYYVMAQWHMEYVQEQQRQQQQQQQQQQQHSEQQNGQGGSREDGLGPSSQQANGEQRPDSASEEDGGGACPSGQEDSQQTITGFLFAVSQMLTSSRGEVFELATQRAMELLSMPGLFKGEDYLQVVEWGFKFLGAGEAFVGAPAREPRALLTDTCARFFDSYHRGNMESLSLLLQNEVWKNASSKPAALKLREAIESSPLHTPAFGEPGAMTRFDEWLMLGNPFTKSNNKKTRKQQAMMDLLQGKASSSPVSRKLSELSLASETESEAQTPRPASAWSTPVLPTVPAEILVSGSGTDANGGEPEGTDRQQRADGNGEVGTSGSTAAPAPAPGGRIVTVSSSQALKFMRAYGQLLRPLSPRSPDIYRAMCDVFDNYLLSCFILFSGITLQGLVFQDDIISTRLKSTVMRILTSPNSRYRYAVEELTRMKPLHASRASAATTGMSFLDRFANKMESLASDLEKSVAGMHQRINDKVQSIQMPAAIASLASELARAVERVDALGQQGVDSGNLYGLHERIAATDSLMHMADELKAGRQALTAVLPEACHREVDVYFSPRGTVEAAQDLRDTLFRGAARKLLADLLDDDRGSAQQIATTNYALKEPLSAPSSWVEHAVKCYGAFQRRIARAGLPQSAVVQVWDHAVSTGAEAIVDGLSRIKRCTFEGRASMSYDLSHVVRSVRGMAPAGTSGSFHTADSYIKAFYLPWDELPRWCQVHLPEYGQYRLIALVELMADTYRVKRALKAELLEKIAGYAREYAHS